MEEVIIRTESSNTQLMQIIKLLLVIFLPGILFSQKYYQGDYQISAYHESSNFRNFPQRELYKKEFIEKNKIRSLTEKSNGKEELVIRKTYFNERGLVKQITTKDDTITYKYINDTVLKSISIDGKKKKVINYSYLNGKQIAKEISTDGELTSLFLTQYNGENKISFTSLQNGKKLKNNYLLKYYYENNELRSQQFYKKGKKFRTWDYSCSSEGKEVKEVKKETTFSFCEYTEESNDGSYIEYERRQYGSAIYLHKRYYNKDSTLYKYEDINGNGTIYRSSLYTKDSVVELTFDTKNRVRESTTWQLYTSGKAKAVITKIYNRNKLKQTRSVFYDEQRKKVKTINQYGKKKNIQTYLYNANGIITEKKSINKGKTHYTYTYDYEFY